jgi:hypothetical protein
MGFKVNVNFILRQDIPEPVVVGKEYPFEKEGLSLLADELPLWLAAKDWTALADIQITSQQRKDGKTTGTFVVKHAYQDDEQAVLTAILQRMCKDSP